MNWLFGSKNSQKKTGKKQQRPAVSAGSRSATQKKKPSSAKTSNSAAVGAFILSDTTMLFLELQRKDGQMQVGGYGEVTIPFEVLIDGQLQEKNGFVKTFRKIRSMTRATKVLFWDEADQSKELADNFVMAGFTSARPVVDARTLLRVFVKDRQTERVAWLYKDGEEYELYEAQAGTVRLVDQHRNLVTLMSNNREMLREIGQPHIEIAGELSYSQAMEFDNIEGIEVVPAQVWRNVTDFNHYVPPIHRENSLQYALPISMALSELAPLSYEDLPKALKKRDTKTPAKSLADSLGSVKPVTPKDY